MTSHSEASPKSVSEALFKGLPVVSTDVGDVSQYLHDGINGILIAPGDADALTAGMEELLRIHP